MPLSLMNSFLEALHDKSLPAIESLQTSFPNNKNSMINISTLLDPRYVFLIYAPILFALNKRVGHRTIIALTLTEWANQILKWLLAGERPYWYVHERAHELATSGLGQQQQTMMTTTDGHNITGGSLMALTGIESYDMAALLVAKQQQQQQHQQQDSSPPLLSQIKQFPVTCELGAGSPSGHAMVTATVWYILIDAYLKGELPLLSRAPRRPAAASKFATSLTNAAWCCYAAMLILVSLSRVYLACHFPHQCLCGAALGVMVARLVAERLPMWQLRSRHFCMATSFMLATALGTYATLRLMGRNPMWSVDKGMRWCVKKEYIHLDTTPFFSMVRYLGFCLGAGLAYDGGKIYVSGKRQNGCAGKISTTTSKHEEELNSDSGNLLFRRFMGAVAAILFGQLLMCLPIPKTNLNLFYVISFIMYTIFSYSIASPIPKLTKLTFGPPAASQSACSANENSVAPGRRPSRQPQPLKQQ